MTKTLDFVIAGAQKGGSTQLASHLGRVAGVWLPREECPAFESPYYEAEAAESLRYKILLNCQDETVAGIKRPSYLGIAAVPGRIASAFPGTKAILVLRDPVERAVSAYLHKAQYAQIRALPVSEALSALLDGDDLGSPRAYEILHWSRYSVLLPRWEQVFGAALHVVGSSDLRADGDQVVKGVCDFLGVEYRLQQRAPRESNVGVQSMLELRVRRQEKRAIVRIESSTLRMLPRTRNPARLAYGGGMRVAAKALHAAKNSPSESLRLSSTLRSRLERFFEDDYRYVGDQYSLSL